MNTFIKTQNNRL